MSTIGFAETPPTIRLAAQLRRVSWLALIVMIPVVCYFTTQGTWDLTKQNNDGGWSGGFYWAQAESMLVRGRLDVEPTDLLGECFERDGRCYGYFGLTPSLVRLPFLGILRFLHSALTPLYLALALLVAYGAALRMLGRSLCELSEPHSTGGYQLGAFALGALALGPGSTLLLLARPAVYEEAIAWGVAFFLLTLNHVWAWHSRETRSLVPAVVFGILAANARPTAATACGVLGLVAAWACWRRRSTRRELVAVLCLSLLPGLTAAGVFWLKLRTPIPSVLMSKQVQQAPHWREILQRNGGRTSGLIFTPTALLAYFRPDTVVRRPEWPLFVFRFPEEPIRWVPPLPVGGAYVEHPVSVTTTMPLPWIVTVVGAIGLGVERRRLSRARTARTDSAGSAALWERWTFELGLLTSAVAMAALTVTTVGITNRYVADFFATSVVGLAVGYRMCGPPLMRRPLLGTLAGLTGLLLVVWSLVVNLSLATQLAFYWG